MREFLQMANDVAGDKLPTYCPYGWQRDFHAAGKDNPERMLMAGIGWEKQRRAGSRPPAI